MKKKPLLSIIVTVYNSENVLESCLKSIKNQNFKDFELIIVDESSNDKTPEISKKYADLFINEGIERCQQRNAGANKAKTDYLFFLDPDMVLSPNVTKEISKYLNKKTSILVPEVSFGEGFWAKCKTFERLMYREGDIAQIPRVYPKKIFLDVNGFNEIMLGTEDLDLFYRIKKKNKDLEIAEIKSVIYHNEGKLTYSQIVKRMAFYAKPLKEYKKRYPEMLKKQMSPRRYLGKWKNFLRHPILSIGFIIMKGSEWLIVFREMRK